MPEFTCARCEMELDTDEPHGTVETEFLDPDVERLEPDSHFLCPDCYDDLQQFLSG